jgi:hypothetical protein
MVRTARIINVIEVKDDKSVIYFTLEGVQIGGWDEGARVAPPAPQPERPAGKVVKPISPAEAKAEEEKSGERTLDDILHRKPAPKGGT